MIFEFFSGILISISFFLGLRILKILKAINTWIISISRFIYFSGHPVMNEDEIHQRIKILFGAVLKSFATFLLLIVIFFVFLISVLGILSGLNYGFNGVGININLESNISKLILSYGFIIGTVFPLLFLPLFNLKIKKKNNYSSLEKFLHYTFLGNRYIASFLFKIELWLHRKKLKDKFLTKNVYISGLARSGTTALMQTLGQLEEFESLSYRNLPFLMLTKTWPDYNKEAKVKEIERYHKDGVIHSLNSYEAIEEGFWRIMIGNEFIKEQVICGHTVNNDIFNYYYSFRRLVAGNKIYLAKNNNHLLRANSIHYLDEKMGNITMTIVPFRNPLTQAKSLLKQHQQLVKLQQDDDFSLDYMDFLVHHEFGINHKISNLDDETNKFHSSHEVNSPEYWLDVWLFFYSQAYELYSDKKNIWFFCYENYANEPRKSVESLIDALDIENIALEDISIKEYSNFHDLNLDGIDKEFSELYEKLKLISVN